MTSSGPRSTPERNPAREELVREIAREVRDERVLDVMREVPRERFVPPDVRPWAYEDHALAIGEGQTISQPLIVAMMTEALALEGGERVLEIGTGSGYQAAILARLAREVVSVEVHDPLRERAIEVLRDLGVTNVRCLAAGDDLGAPGLAPFDAIIVTAAAPEVPWALLEQLAPEGRIVIPVGDRDEQDLLVIQRHADGSHEETSLGGCRFVPLLGPGGFEPR